MLKVKALSKVPGNHFYGYYGINSWDKSGRYHLALETDFHDRRPTGEDAARVGLVDSNTGVFEAWAETKAFNFQQGSMLHWIDAGFGDEFTYNDWTGEKLVSRAVNIKTRGVRTINGAIAGISPTQPIAIGLNYVRNFKLRPVVGYDLDTTGEKVDPYPRDDGLHLLDLRTGESRLLLSTADVIRANPMKETQEGPAWLDHVVFNTDGSRLMFMCRIEIDYQWYSSLWTVNSDGTDLQCQIDYRYWISHFAWFDSRKLLISTNVLGQNEFVQFTDNKYDFEPFGRGILPKDGHAAFSPDRKWVVCDNSGLDKDRMNELMLYNPERNEKITIGKFHSPIEYSGDIRCDLHPRWNADNTMITFDSVHEGSRQIYCCELPSEISGR